MSLLLPRTFLAPRKRDMMKTLRPQEWKLGGLSTPPDGLCLVYCYLAACNPCLWMARARDDMGFFKDADTEAEVKQEAQALFQKAVDLMVSGGHDTTRLDKGGYPGEDEMPFFSDVFGCGILVQHEKEDCQPAMIYGTQPVGFEIMHVTSTDDAGHGRGHFVLSCTWMVEEPPVVVDRQSWRPIITGGHLKLDIDVPLLRKHGRSVALADKLDVRSVSWAWRQGFIDANISTYHQEVCLKRGPGHVLPSFKCSCPDWAQWLGICKHGVALLQALGAGCRYAVSEAGEERDLHKPPSPRRGGRPRQPRTREDFAWGFFVLRTASHAFSGKQDEEVGSPNDTAVVEKACLLDDVCAASISSRAGHRGRS